MMDVLRNKNYKVSMLLDFHISCDLEMSPEELVSELKDQFMIKTAHEQFIIQSLDMDYQVFKVKDSKDIINV
jgi:hypothetical protein